MQPRSQKLSFYRLAKQFCPLRLIKPSASFCLMGVATTSQHPQTLDVAVISENQKKYLVQNSPIAVFAISVRCCPGGLNEEGASAAGCCISG